MAEANFDGFVAGEGLSRGRSSQLMNVIGGLTTLGLLVGVAVWGYRLAVRDASGIPVILALEGPIRVASDDPGGTVARHIGLSVNRIAAEGSAGEVPEQLVLAEPPVDLQEEDSPGIGTAAPPQLVDAEAKARTLALAEELAATAPPLTVPNAAPPPSQAAVEEDSDPLASAIAAAVADAVGGGSGAAQAGTVASSIRPPPRPRTLAAAAPAMVTRASQAGGAALPFATTTSAAAEPGAVSALAAVSLNGGEELSTADLRPGTRLAQIGAFETVEAAREEWARVAARHPALFEGKTRVVQSASSVGRTFYRLRVAGFASEDDSRRFCSAVSSGDLRCITVTTR